MAEKKPNRPNLTQIQINHIVRKPLRLSYFCQLSLYAEFQLPWFLSKLYIANQTNQTQPKTNLTSSPKTLGSSYFCELSLYAEFQLPRLFLSFMSMVEAKSKIEKKIKQPN